MTSIMKLSINNQSFNLILDEGSTKVELNGKSYASLADLVNSCYYLTENQYIKEIALLSNHLFFGLEFKLITEPEPFKQRYWKKIQQEQREKPTIPMLLNHGIFDVSKITLPKRQNNELICFLEQLSTGLPFELRFPFPFNRNDSEYHLKILPYAEANDES